MACNQWWELYNGSFVTHLPKRKSDHLPLLLNINTRLHLKERRAPKKIFRFEEMWLRESSCEEVITRCWQQGGGMMHNLGATAKGLVQWGKKVFGSVPKELRAYRARMEELMKDEQTEQVVNEIRAIDTRMDELEEREERYWKQRSRQCWLEGGDRNSKFFHAKAEQRRQRNSVNKIADEAGNEYVEEAEIAEIFVKFFEDLFTTNGSVDVEPVLNKVTAHISESEAVILGEPFTAEEVRHALFQMHPSKAPGPDGMSAMFFQKFWGVVE